MLDSLKKVTDIALRAGISGYDREDRRRLSIVNLAGYLAAASSVSYAINFSFYDFTNLKWLIFGNLASALVTASVAFWHRFNSVLGAIIISFTVAFSLFYFVSQLGTDSGTHLNYIGGVAVAFAIFGLKKFKWIGVVGLTCVILNILCEFWFTKGQVQWAIDDGFMAQLYILSVGSIIAIVGLVVWYAFRIAEDAEMRSEQLLLNIFPQRIADELRLNPNLAIADRFDEATVMFADIVGFTQMSDKMSPTQMVEALNIIFTEFDTLCKKHGVEKIKTIGDEYMAVSGAPEPNEDHAIRILSFAKDMITASEQLSAETGQKIQLRIGVATGSITAGVIGKSKFAYDVWASTVNLASRLQSTSKIGKIHVSDSTYIATRNTLEFEAAPQKSLKGLGQRKTWFVIAK
ncbi:MAG: adenylate/guanylate cyclase domain-containing protein [Nitratireductor sp.]